jgi:hypothetical protein
MWFLTVTVA